MKSDAGVVDAEVVTGFDGELVGPLANAAVISC